MFLKLHIVILVLFVFTSCRKENHENIMMDYQFCEDSLVSFQNHIQPLLQSDCVSCHSSTNAEGNIELETYTDVKFFAENGWLLGSVKHESGFVPMPAGRLKWNDCKILTLQRWIEEGMLDN